MLRLLPLLLCAWTAACSVEQAPLLAENVVLKPPLAGANMAAGYLVLRNTTSQTIVIDRVVSPELAAVAMHESVLQDGIVRMQELREIVIPPHQSIVFEAGGKHLMLRYPAIRPEKVTLQFFAGASMLISLQVHSEE